MADAYAYFGVDGVLLCGGCEQPMFVMARDGITCKVICNNSECERKDIRYRVEAMPVQLKLWSGGV
jgi:hypothetical protein